MKNTFTFLIILLVCSCGDLETVVELDVPDHEPVLVLNSSINNQSEIKLFISHSIDAFGDMVPSCISDANVLLFENEIFVDSLFPDFQDPSYFSFIKDRVEDSILVYYYKSDIIPSLNNSYNLEVNHPVYPSVSASTRVPIGVDINLLQTTDSEFIKFNFYDEPSQTNYYELKVYVEGTKEYNGEIVTYRERLEFGSNDLSFPGDIPFDGYTFYGRKVIFDDALFNGTQKQISIEIVDEEYIPNSTDSIYFEFTELSTEAYNYYSSRNSQIEDGAVGIFGGEVIPVYSNVENGLGVFISFNTQNIYLD